MSTTNTPEQTHETCVPTWYGQHIERATVLNSNHIATVTAALTGIQAVVGLLHDREAKRNEGEATHCPMKNMGLLAAVHSLTTLVQLHMNEDAEELPDFIRDTQGVQEVRSATYGHWVCVAGISSTADPAALKESDFYALDPARVNVNGTLAVTRLLDGTIWTNNSPLKIAG